MATGARDLENYYIYVYIQGYKGIPKQSYIVPVASFARARFPAASMLPDIPRQDEYFTKTMMRQHILFHAEQVCRYEVSKWYVSEQIQPADILMVMFEYAGQPREGEQGDVRGFILGQFTEDRGTYLDVVCSSKYGLHLIDYFVILSRQLGMSYIKLNSLPKVLSLYPRYGFQHRKSCSREAEVVMSPELTKKWRDYHNFSVDDFYNDEPALQFMYALHRHGYSADERPECKSRRISLDEFTEHKCALDGFTMRLCLEPPSSSAANIASPSPIVTARLPKKVLKKLGPSAARGTRRTLRLRVSKKPTKKTKKTGVDKKHHRTKAKGTRRTLRLHVSKKPVASKAMDIDD